MSLENLVTCVNCRVGQVIKMSRPTTRSKNKRHRQEDNVDITSEILR